MGGKKKNKNKNGKSKKIYRINDKIEIAIEIINNKYLQFIFDIYY